MIEPLIFYSLATLIILSSIMVISARSAVISALFLVLDLFLLACLYASLNAHFVAVIQLLVYAGAILVLFLFVIMLLNVDPKSGQRQITFGGVTLCAVAVLVFLAISYHLLPTMTTELDTSKLGTDNTYRVAILLFTKYLWPFELASILILLAMVASVIIARKPS